MLDELAHASLIVIDDVHVLDRHATAQEALLSLASRALAGAKQLVLTSDDAAGASALAHRIVHRFRTGHSATLGVPDWSHRVAILHAKAATLGVELPPSVAHHLASQCEGSVRELEGSLTRLLAVASLDGSALTLALARRAVPTRVERGDGVRAPHALLGAQVVQDAVAAEWGVAPDELVGAGRSRRVVEPRRIGMLLCQRAARPVAARDRRGVRRSGFVDGVVGAGARARGPGRQRRRWRSAWRGCVRCCPRRARRETASAR